MSLLPELKLRYVVTELAKDIIEIEDILAHVEISKEEYLKLSQTRAFKDALTVANTEWQGATNTYKRVKLKAAAITEEMMLNLFILARDNKEESLSAKTKLFSEISKIAGLNTPDPALAAGGGVMGNVFNLQINYANGGEETLVIGSPIIEGNYESQKDDDQDSVIEPIHDLTPELMEELFEEL